MSRISAPRGSFGYAQDRSFDSAPSAVLRDKSVRRFAQDDDFVGGLKKNTPNRLTLVGRSPGLRARLKSTAGTTGNLRGDFCNSQILTHALKLSSIQLFTARLKSCRDTKRVFS